MNSVEMEEDYIIFLSKVFRIEPEILEYILSVPIWESNRTNYTTTQKLLKRGLITKLSRGLYKFDLVFIKILDCFLKQPRKDFLTLVL